jgi:hypothetical protein
MTLVLRIVDMSYFWRGAVHLEKDHLQQNSSLTNIQEVKEEARCDGSHL